MSPGAPALSVVVPTLDEEAAIGGLLRALADQQDIDLEVIVSDGGSRDATVGRARAAGATVVEGPPGRGRQLNAGRAAATAPWLLFLHADSVLLAPDLLARALDFAAAALGPRDAGHFPLCFVDAGALGLDMGFNEAKSALGRPETTHGDQGLLIRGQTLAVLGGYDDALPILEDQDLGRRLVAAGGRFRRLPGCLGTSARRFAAEGKPRRAVQNATLMVLFHAGLLHLLPRLQAHYPPPHGVRAPGTRALFRALHQTLAELPAGEREAAWRALGREAGRLGMRDLVFALEVGVRGPEQAAAHHPWLDRWEASGEPRWLAGRDGRWTGRVLRGGVGLGARLARLSTVVS